MQNANILRCPAIIPAVFIPLLIVSEFLDPTLFLEYFLLLIIVLTKLSKVYLILGIVVKEINLYRIILL